MVQFKTRSGNIKEIADAFVANGFSIEAETPKKVTLVYKGLLLYLYNKHNAGYTDILLSPNKKMLVREKVGDTLNISIDFDKLKKELDHAAAAKEIRVSLNRGLEFMKTLMESVFKPGTSSFTFKDAKGAVIMELGFYGSVNLDVIIPTHTHDEKNQFLDCWKDTNCKVHIKNDFRRRDVIQSFRMTLGELSSFIVDVLYDAALKSKEAQHETSEMYKRIHEEYAPAFKEIDDEIKRINTLLYQANNKKTALNMKLQDEHRKESLEVRKKIINFTPDIIRRMLEKHNVEQISQDKT